VKVLADSSLGIVERGREERRKKEVGRVREITIQSARERDY
jgi:hypothetical protein